MKKLHLLLLSVLVITPAWGASTVDPNVPAPNSNLTSAPLRGNFAAANTDINNLLTSFAGPNAPTNPSVGQLWRKTNVSPQIVSQWSGTAWLPYSTLDVANGKVTPKFGNSLLAWQQLLTGTGGLGTSGQCIISTGSSTVPTTQNCISGTITATPPLAYNSGTQTFSLSYGSNFTLSGSNLVLANIIAAGGPTGTASTVPVITYNQWGQITAVTTATITPTAIGAVPTTRAITAGTGLTGGCVDLTANCSFSIASVVSAGGPTGSATQTPVITYNAQGQITAVSLATIAPPFSAVTGQATLAQLPTLSASTVLGSIAGGTPVGLTATQLTTLCNQFTTTLSGCVPLTTSATGKILSDGGWIAAPGGTGTVTSVGYAAGTGLALSGTASPIVGSGSFTYGFAAISADSFWLNATGGSAVPTQVALPNCPNGIAYNTTSHVISCASVVTSVSITAGTGITQSGSPITGSGAITVNVDKATASNYYAATSNKVTTTDVIYQPEVTVTFSTTPTFDFSTFVDAVMTLTNNVSSITLSNITVGKRGRITLIQDATGGRTIPVTFATGAKCAGAACNFVLSTAANAIDIIDYDCRAAAFCRMVLSKAWQ